MDNIDLELKEKIINKLSNLTEIAFERNRYEISLPIFLDNSYKISIFLSKIGKTYILYNNLYVSLEESISKNIKRKEPIDVRKSYLENEDEFKEMKTILKNNKVDTGTLSLNYVIDSLDNIEEEVLIYSEFVKKYYNNIYNVLLSRLGTSKERKDAYYKNFSQIIKNYKGKNKFSEVQYNGLSGSPIYLNEKMVVTASKDFESLTKLYIDLEDLPEETRGKKGLLIYAKGKKSEKVENLEQKLKNKNFKLIFFKGEKDTDTLKKTIDKEIASREKDEQI